jgi:hypothetical protein
VPLEKRVPPAQGRDPSNRFICARARRTPRAGSCHERQDSALFRNPRPAICRWAQAAPSFALVIGIYIAASDARHRENPRDKFLPSVSPMAAAVERMALEEGPRSIAFQRHSLFPHLTGLEKVLVLSQYYKNLQRSESRTHISVWTNSAPASATAPSPW